MKAHGIKSLGALLLLGALLAACSNEKIVEEPQVSQAAEVVHFTATLAPKSEGSSRAITNEWVDGKEILNVSWKQNEEIAIYYQTNSGWATATATVGKPNADGSATISATLSNAKPNGEAKFVYPATLHNGSGGIDESQLLNNQNGKLRPKNSLEANTTNTISKHFDAATGKGTLSVSGSTATINGNIGMKNEVCILKIELFFDEGNNVFTEGGMTLNILVGGRTYTITSQFQHDDATSVNPYRPFQTYDEIYVAMLPFTSQSVLFSSAKANGTTYRFVTTASLEAGKFYRNVPVTLTKGEVLLDLRQGSFTALNGCIITSNGHGTDNTITIPDGYTVTLRNVNILSPIACIACLGSATIILEGTNSVKCNGDAPGIQPGPSGSTLTISGDGSLTATGSGFAAGIGCGFCVSCGNITIAGGTITATGGKYAAGIGSGMEGACGNITITNSVTRVTAYKGLDAPYSIGRGRGGSTCGTITIGGMTYYDTGEGFQNDGEDILSQSPFTYEPPTP